MQLAVEQLKKKSPEVKKFLVAVGPWPNWLHGLKARTSHVVGIRT
jgi:hypothetical protein